MIHVLILALYKLFVCLLNFLLHILPSLLFSFFLFAFLLIYFPTYLFLPEWTHSVSRLQVIGGD